MLKVEDGAQVEVVETIEVAGVVEVVLEAVTVEISEVEIGMAGAVDIEEVSEEEVSTDSVSLKVASLQF